MIVISSLPTKNNKMLLTFYTFMLPVLLSLNSLYKHMIGCVFVQRNTIAYTHVQYSIIPRSPELVVPE